MSGVVVIDSSHLLARDGVSSDEEIVYEITRQPEDGYLGS